MGVFTFSLQFPHSENSVFNRGHPWPQLYLAPPNLEAQFYLLQKIICCRREPGILDFNLPGFGSFFKKNINLFGCAGSLLRHVGSRSSLWHVGSFFISS